MKTLHNNKGFATLAVMVIFLMLGIGVSQLTVAPSNILYKGLSFGGEVQPLLLPATFSNLVENKDAYTLVPMRIGEFTMALCYFHPTEPNIAIIAAARCPMFLGVSLENTETGEVKCWKYIKGEPWPCSQDEFMKLVFIEDDPCVKPKTI